MIDYIDAHRPRTAAIVATMSVRPIRLDLGAHAPGTGVEPAGIAVVDETLFLIPDEGATLLRLSRTDVGWGDALSLPLADVVTLPGNVGDEVGVEGLDVAEGCLWVSGSHGPTWDAARCRSGAARPHRGRPGAAAARAATTRGLLERSQSRPRRAAAGRATGARGRAG